MESILHFVHQELTSRSVVDQMPEFRAGDNITVNYKIVEGGKERIQAFRGDVIKRQGQNYTQTFTVRKISQGIGVERTFPLFSPNVVSVELNKRGKVRQSRIYYVRALSGKKARIKERIVSNVKNSSSDN